MDVKIEKAISGGTVRAVSSKSHVHRLLICAALADSPSFIACAESSGDIDATVRCLIALGAGITRETGGFTVRPMPLPVSRGRKSLDCGESGSTLRFLLPVACALGAEAAFIMDGRLPERPLSPLYEELTSHGCSLSERGQNPLTIDGRLRGGLFSLRGDISSQFISGLLFALPLTDGGTIEVAGKMESVPYIDMTAASLAQFGIDVVRSGGSFRVGRADYVSPGSISAEGDWSNAAFWLCAGGIGPGSVTCTNLSPDSLQGDRAVLNLLERFGAGVSRGSGGVTVSPGHLRGISVDASDTPDLVPVIAAVAAVSEGRTVITGAGRLRLKESDRLHSVCDTLGKLGADISELEGGLVINGKANLLGGDVSSFGDHRIAMTAAVVSAACSGDVTIRDAGAVNKSYPGFFDDFRSLGGIAKEVV